MVGRLPLEENILGSNPSPATSCQKWHFSALFQDTQTVIYTGDSVFSYFVLVSSKVQNGGDWTLLGHFRPGTFRT